ncbi:MAG TPA: hypothetical protein VFV27_08745 [Nevskiaceae bacterium]|nr:hypothetical protein [Nevskiaceae bacterium]
MDEVLKTLLVLMAVGSALFWQACATLLRPLLRDWLRRRRAPPDLAAAHARIRELEAELATVRRP